MYVCMDIPLYGAHKVMTKIGFKNKTSSYALDECDWLDTSSWTSGPLPKCGEHCKADNGSCSSCGHAVGLTRTDLIRAAVLAGCDYTNGLPYVGIRRACTMIREYKSIAAAFKSFTSSRRSQPLAEHFTWLRQFKHSGHSGSTGSSHPRKASIT